MYELIYVFATPHFAVLIAYMSYVIECNWGAETCTNCLN